MRRLRGSRTGGRHASGERRVEGEGPADWARALVTFPTVSSGEGAMGRRRRKCESGGGGCWVGHHESSQRSSLSAACSV
jgi:hypothetical protein